jgi:hypothetical protein
MLSVLRWGIAGIAMVNLVAGVALGVAFGWHDWLKPKFARRRARQRSFERLLARSPIDNTSALPEPSDALGSHGAQHV